MDPIISTMPYLSKTESSTITASKTSAAATSFSSTSYSVYSSNKWTSKRPIPNFSSEIVTDLNSTITHENFVSPTISFHQNFSRNYSRTGVYLLASIPSFALILIITLMILIRCKNQRKRRLRQRRSRIVRDLGMIQMSSVVNNQYMGPDEANRYKY